MYNGEHELAFAQEFVLMVEEDKIEMTATTQEYEAALVHTFDGGTQALGQLGELGMLLVPSSPSCPRA